MRLLAKSVVMLLTAFTVGSVTASAQATVLRHLTISQLGQKARLIVRGRVKAQHVVPIGKHLWTDNVITIETVYKGSLRSQHIVVRQFGGKDTDGSIWTVAGTATLQVGESVLLCLLPVGDRYALTGMAQGKFSLYRKSDGQWRARRDVNDVMWLTAHNATTDDIHRLNHSDIALDELVSALGFSATDANRGEVNR